MVATVRQWYWACIPSWPGQTAEIVKSLHCRGHCCNRRLSDRILQVILVAHDATDAGRPSLESPCLFPFGRELCARNLEVLDDPLHLAVAVRNVADECWIFLPQTRAFGHSARMTQCLMTLQHRHGNALSRILRPEVPRFCSARQRRGVSQ